MSQQKEQNQATSAGTTSVGTTSAGTTSAKVYSPKNRGYQRNCSICGCIVYHPFGDVYEYYCSSHSKHDCPYYS